MKIAILSRGRTLYSTCRIADAARRRRHDVRVIDPMSCSVGVPGMTLMRDGISLEDFDLVIPRVGASSMDVSLHVLRQFELMGVRVLNRCEAIMLSKDKFASHQVLAHHGVAMPRTVLCRDAAALPGVIESLGGAPVVIKVIRGTHGAGVVVADTTAAAVSVMDMVWGFEGEALIQEFVHEASGSDIRVFVVGGVAVAAMRRVARVEGEFRANLHLGGEGEPVELTPQLREIAVRAASVLGLEIAGVDILMSAHGPLVIEANASPGLQGIEAATGVDIGRHIIGLAERGHSEGVGVMTV